MAVPNTFATKTGTILLSELDENFATPITIGTTDIALGDTATTISGLILSGADLGTPTGNLANCTFPTLNQNTTGTASSVTGLVNVGNGGTGLTSLTSGYIPYGNGTGALSSSAGLLYSGGNFSIGSGNPVNSLRYLDVYNIDSGASAGSIIRLITSDVAGTGLAIVDMVKYKTGQFTISNSETNASAFTSFNVGVSERMRIDSSGNVGIGTTNPAGKLDVTGSDIVCALTGTNTGNVSTLRIQRYQSDGDGVTFYYGTNQKGYISITSTGTTYNSISDYRLKENIVPMVGALDRVMQLNPVSYVWKDNQKADEGFIAHEVKNIVPSAVAGEKDELDDEGNPKYQGLDQSRIVSVLTAAIQEQQTLIEALTERLTALENK